MEIRCITHNIIIPNDIWFEISKHINTGSDWKSFIFTCKSFSKFNNQSKINKLANHLTTLIKLHPDEPWDWGYISRNPNITIDFIEANPHKPWNWGCISGNPNLTMEFI